MLNWVIGALAVLTVIVGVAIFLLMRDDTGTEAGTEESLTMFINQCAMNLVEHGAIKLEHTHAQLNSACTCLGKEFQEDIAGMSASGIKRFLDAAPGNMRMRTVAGKCFQQAGLEYAD